MPSYNVISHEKDISTFSTQATKQARFPQAHVFCQRTQRLELTPSERPQEVERKFGATPQRHRAISNAFHSAERRPHRKGADELLFFVPINPERGRALPRPGHDHQPSATEPNGIDPRGLERAPQRPTPQRIPSRAKPLPYPYGNPAPVQRL